MKNIAGTVLKGKFLAVDDYITNAHEVRINYQIFKLE